MDNPRFERYLVSPPRKPGKLTARLHKLCDELAHKIGLRQLKPQTALIAALLFVTLAGFGLARSGLFRAASASGNSAAAITGAPASGASGAADSSVPAPAPETTVTVHVVVDQQGTAAVAEGGGAVAATGASAAPTGGKINLNTADEPALQTLPGIGPATAQKIIADRNSHGPFRAPEDLMRVSGIGPKKYDALKDLITAP